MTNDNEIIHMGGNTASDLRERVTALAGLRKVEIQLKGRTKEVGTQIREGFKKAQAAGHDPGVLKKVVAEAVMTVEERLELYDNEERTDAVVNATRDALGLKDPDGTSLEVDKAAAEAAKDHEDLLAGNDVVEDEPVFDR